MTLSNQDKYITWKLNMNKKTGTSHLTHISDILSKALSKYKPPQETEITQIWKIWDLSLGTSIAQNAKPDTFKNGQLQVIVSSSVWIHQLKFLEKEMIANLNARLNTALITHLRFKIGEIHY
jgi:predicted nucleic acid-binding Zn ribbon protein